MTTLMRPIVLILFTLISFAAHAQKQNNNWCYGHKSGLNFSTSPPTFFATNVDTDEGVASVSDPNTGDLLFYASTKDVYNVDNVIMPNGNDIGVDPNGTCAQGVMIVPFVQDKNKYYIFTLSPQGTNGVLAYSVVDITLDGGKGDVVSGQKMVPVDSNFGESMVVTEGCGYYWLIVSRAGTSSLYAYKITATGIAPSAVISITGYPNIPGKITHFKVSPDRQMLGITCWIGDNGYSYAAIHSFDRKNGTVSNGMVISEKQGSHYYGCEFSPNSRMFYVNSYYDRDIYQFDLSSGNQQNIINSKKFVIQGHTRQMGALQLGPDNNIYMSNVGGTSLNMISNANLPVPQCTFTVGATSIPSGSTAGYGLPMSVVFSEKEDPSLYPNRTDTSICFAGSKVVLRGQPLRQGYEWQNGSMADSLVVVDSGTYWVTMQGGCKEITDTFVITRKVDTVATVTDTLMCEGDKILLTAKTHPTQATYMWNTEQTDRAVLINSKGNYWVRTTEECLITTDTFDVDYIPLSVDLGADTAICVGDTATLYANVQPATAYFKWSTGSEDPSIKITTPGLYKISASNMGCTETDERVVTFYPKPTFELGSDTEICRSDRYVLPRLSTIDSATFTWQDGSNNRKYIVQESGRYTLTVNNKCGTFTDTVDISVRDCNLFFASAFTPNGDGLNDKAHLVGDLTNVKDFVLRIYNRRGQEVYMTTNINDGWDGMHNGQPAAMDTYYYFIKYIYMGEEYLDKGDLTLIR